MEIKDKEENDSSDEEKKVDPELFKLTTTDNKNEEEIPNVEKVSIDIFKNIFENEESSESSISDKDNKIEEKKYYRRKAKRR